MNSVVSLEHTCDRAREDIERCFANSDKRKNMNGDYFVDNPHIYVNASEKVMQAVKGEVKEEDKVLAVASSGDYLLDSVLYGASDVTVFDLNANQYYITCLKVWAVQVLDYQEYVDLFTTFRSGDEIKYFAPATLKKVIEPFKGEPAYPFWERFISQREKEIETFEKTLSDPITFQLLNALIDDPELGMIEFAFNNMSGVGQKLYPDVCVALRMVQSPEADISAYGYLSSEEDYKLLQERLKEAKLSYVTSNVTELGSKLGDEKFDAVFLSNIPFYLDPNDFVDSIMGLMPHLTEDGKICYYHQNMRQRWFKQAAKDKNFKLPVSNFKNDEYFSLAVMGVSNSLLGHRKLVKQPVYIKMVEVPTYGGMETIKSPYDIKVLVKNKKSKK